MHIKFINIKITARNNPCKSEANPKITQTMKLNRIMTSRRMNLETNDNENQVGGATCWRMKEDNTITDRFFVDTVSLDNNETVQLQTGEELVGEMSGLIQDLFSVHDHYVQQMPNCWNGFEVQVDSPSNAVGNVLLVDEYHNFTIRVQTRQMLWHRNENIISQFNRIIMPMDFVSVRLVLCDILSTG